ncbi:beta-lactamase family protein [candidate division KSB1 bacterium]|nr:beta-lactamase family protein [candidate division KSB1 bacterium]
MSKRKVCLLTMLAAVMLFCSSPKRSTSEQLQRALEKNLEKYGVRGASAAIILPDGTTRLVVGGVSHDSIRIEPNMVFAIGSITKNMVAALALQLAEEGVLSLEDSLHRWLPSYPHVDSSITIRQLLNHTSGLYMFWDNQKIWDDLKAYRTRVFTPEEVLGYIQAPYFAPGKGHRYSNTNYLLAAMILTKATGSSLSAEFRERFWQPLGLRSACLAIEEPLPDNLAHVWGDNFENDGSMRDLTFLPQQSHDSITYGSAGVFMAAEDLARWMHALFNDKVINKASLKQMLTLVPGSYGLGIGRFGWRLAGWKLAYGHGGGNIGTVVYAIHLPEHNISIAVMINRYHGKCAESIMKNLVNIVTQASFSKNG